MKVATAILKEDGNPKFSRKINGLTLAAKWVSDAAHLGIVVAPEYFFRHQNATKEWMTNTIGSSGFHMKDYHIDSSAKNYIKDRLLELSDKYRNVLIVPGTIAWREPSKDRNLSGLKDLSFLGNTNNLMIDENSKADLLQFKQLGLDLLDYILHSTMYIYHDGKEVALDKEGDFQESTNTSILIPEKNQMVRTFQCGKQSIRVGFEICLDHAVGRLRKHLGTQAVDIHIVVSDFTPNVPAHFCARDGGLVIHASTQDRFETASDRFVEISFDGGMTFYIWDKRTGSWRAPKASVKGGKGTYSLQQEYDPVTNTLTPALVRQASHDKRVTNVFQRKFNKWQSLKVSHSIFDFFQVCNTVLL